MNLNFNMHVVSGRKSDVDEVRSILVQANQEREAAVSSELGSRDFCRIFNNLQERDKYVQQEEVRFCELWQQVGEALASRIATGTFGGSSPAVLKVASEIIADSQGRDYLQKISFNPAHFPTRWNRSDETIAAMLMQHKNYGLLSAAHFVQRHLGL